MATPTTLTINYGSSLTATITLPTSDGSTPQDYHQAVKNLYLGGGFWTVIGGVNTFVPWSAITSITAQ